HSLGYTSTLRYFGTLLHVHLAADMRVLACSWLLVTAVVVAVLVEATSAKVYGKCELARVLEQQYGLQRQAIKNWV
ncbi:hypothetical protein CGJ15_27535, partial [Vibrio parahaemolyticus]